MNSGIASNVFDVAVDEDEDGTSARRGRGRVKARIELGIEGAVEPLFDELG